MSEEASADPDVVEQSETKSSGGRLSNISWRMAITAGFMGLLIGGFAAWATANMGVAGLAFLVGFAGATYYLYQKPIPSAAIGSGLYITAIIMAVTPIFFYLPNVLSGSDGTAEGAGAFVGSIMGLIIWGFVFFILAIVTFVIGYFANRRAKKKLDVDE